MDDILKLKYINKLKETYRFAAVGNRNESSAEHSWSALIIADYFLLRISAPIDRLKLYELIIYHDLVEIDVGDTPLIPGEVYAKKDEIAAAKILKEKLPLKLGEKYFDLFKEFEEQKTKEAKLAKIIDALDADIHELDYINDWKGWTQEYYLKKRVHLFNEFPELKLFFNEFVIYLKENNYLE